ncbi:hypothetical protein [Sphingomonas sp. BAUL-RG-20F-R05-02]|uniref:hypothetical protein n=1 Tax=Sphingomonas sp. BAUL-RG-20F-R05-02 TaxID=2914830 RepID=UPI001F5AD011|nr:hypothetical protein [Sphingomonas sp. BAUL-RG-20F-R05-02]
MADPTNAELALRQTETIAQYEALMDDYYDFAFGTVGGGPNGDGSYPFHDLKTGEVVFRKCAAQLEFESTIMPIVKLVGSSNLVLTAAHSGKKILPFNGTQAVNLTMGPDIRPGFNCLVEQYQAGKIHFLGGATAVLHTYPDKYEYSAGRYAHISVTCDEAPSGINQVCLAGGLSNIP